MNSRAARLQLRLLMCARVHYLIVRVRRDDWKLWPSVDANWKKSDVGGRIAEIAISAKTTWSERRIVGLWSGGRL